MVILKDQFQKEGYFKNGYLEFNFENDNFKNLVRNLFLASYTVKNEYNIDFRNVQV